MVQLHLAVLLYFFAAFCPITPIESNSNAVLDRIIHSYLNSRSASDVGLTYRDLLVSANQRDEEYLPENTLWGYQYISGGSGEQHLTPEGVAKTTQQEVKSDSKLPAYCNPPNPCPIGYTERDGCFTKFENSAENNRNYQRSQDCPCDADHMFSCPAGSKVINTKSRKATASLGSGVAHALGDQESNEKRPSVVAKKSPEPMMNMEGPFDDYLDSFDADILKKRLAKKSPYA